jgi:hypothetical protein
MMPSPEERALLTHVQDQLIELYVAQNEAREDRDPVRVDELQVEIDRLREECDLLQHAD